MAQSFSPPRIPEKIRAALARWDPTSVARAEAFLATAARPCVDFESRRVSAAPYRRGALARLLGFQEALPVLPALASKFGGRPYVTATDGPWPHELHFLVQINLADLPPGHLSSLPTRGLLAVDVQASVVSDPWAHRIRFYPEPSEELAVDPGRTPSRTRYETQLRFEPAWSYPQGEAWEKAVGVTTEDEAWEVWYEWQSDAEQPPLGVRGHRILGFPPISLDELHAFKPRAGALSDYEMLLRIHFDNPSGLAWGSNVGYVVIHRDDLARGRLQNAAFALGNL